MKFEVIVNQATRAVTLDPREDGTVEAQLDGESSVVVDVRRAEHDVWSLIIDGASYECTVQPIKNFLRVSIRGATWDIQIYDPRRIRQGSTQAGDVDGKQVIISPMPGRVIRLEVAVGDTVEAGQGIVIVEAMKMENELEADRAGTVKEIQVAEGDTVESDQVLVIIE